MRTSIFLNRSNTARGFQGFNKTATIILTLFVLLILLSINCKRRSTKSDLTLWGTKEFDLNISNYSHGEVRLSSVCDSIEYVFLETTDSNYIGDIDYVKISTKYIVLADNLTNKIHAFKRNGDYLGEISRRGKGPGEFLKVDDLIIDEINNCVYLSAGRQLIQKFSLTNKYLGTISLEVGPRFISLYQNGIVGIVKCPNTRRFSGFTFNFMNEQGKITDQKLKHDITGFSGKEPLSYSTLYTLNDTLHFWEAYFDTIYCMPKNGKVIPKWCFTRGNTKTKFNQDQLKSIPAIDNTIRNGFLLQSFIESPNNVFVSAMNFAKLVHIVYDKDRNEYFLLTDDKGANNYFLKNDLDGIINYWPKFSCASNTTLMVVEPSIFIKSFQQVEKEGKNLKIIQKYFKQVNNLKEFDNPILCIVKHK
jgi:hypothetical protein